MEGNQSIEQRVCEHTLIQIGKRYIRGDGSPEFETVTGLLFDFAHLVTDPRTDAGKAIKAFVNAEELTDFSLSCNDEYTAMQNAVVKYEEYLFGIVP
jgi:hypothetical protein